MKNLFNNNLEQISREEMKNEMFETEQGRSLAKKNLEMEYPWLTIRKGFEWMTYNFHWVVIGMCVAMSIFAWWAISNGYIK